MLAFELAASGAGAMTQLGRRTFLGTSVGALAFLHLTSTSTSVPPHTVAWIYNSASNETIVYVNPTGETLEIGDPSLLEIHLQGVVSVQESDFIYQATSNTVAAGIEAIDSGPSARL